MTIYYFSRTRVTHQFCHSGTAKVEIGQLKKIMWYSSMVNSSTMQHNTRVPFYNKMFFFSYSTRAHQARVPWKPFFWGLSKNKHKHKMMFFFSTVLDLGELEYLVNFFFFFWDYQKININIKISSFFTFLFI